MADKSPRTCGQIYVEKLKRKIWVHAKKGESCAEARKRVAANWEANPKEVESEKDTAQLDSQEEGSEEPKS
jgi:hypothetical protein